MIGSAHFSFVVVSLILRRSHFTRAINESRHFWRMHIAYTQRTVTVTFDLVKFSRQTAVYLYLCIEKNEKNDNYNRTPRAQ